MDDWSETLQWIILAIIMLVVLYMLIHMVVNWLKGKDIVDGLFVFKRAKKDQE